MYYIWGTIRQRCNNPNNKKYKNYGARGIKVCVAWNNSFQCFKEWSLKNGYEESLSIDRIDNNKGYSPENCRWVTQKVQQNNRNDNVRFTYEGETHTISEWSEIYGLNYSTLWYRIFKENHSFEEAITMTLKDCGKHYLTYNGKTQCMADWAKELNIPRNTIKSRIRKGWCIEKVLSTSCQRKGVYGRFITYKGKTQNLTEWCKELSLNYKTVSTRLFKGWTVQRAFEEKIHK